MQTLKSRIAEIKTSLEMKFLLKKFFRKIEEVNFNPIFIIGTNRSGTSITSYLLNQHPELEGLYHGNMEIGKVESSGHVIGFNESNFIWSWLNSGQKQTQNSEVLDALWGHPAYISGYYRNYPTSTREALQLVNSVQRYRKTARIPLIKDQFNILRIGLIRSVFPKAKFILVIREIPDYIQSCVHKWLGAKAEGEAAVGLHWLTLNNLAIYEMEKYAPGDYCVMNYLDYFEKPKALQKKLTSMISKLGLSPFDFDLSQVKSEYRFLGAQVIKEEIDFEIPAQIAKLERQLYSDMKKNQQNGRSS